MPTRTINLKLILGRRANTAELRRALWTTHYEINKAVERIERLLLFCRGAAYRNFDHDGNEIAIAESEVVANALTVAREAQTRNGTKKIVTDEDVLIALRELYEQIVPSCLLDEKGNPMKGDAQSSNAWVSPLMDPESEGGLSVFSKVLDPPPEWVRMKAADQTGWEEKSKEWLGSADGRRLQSTPGSPPGWVRKLRNGQPWQDSFIVDQAKKREALAQGNAPVIKRLKELGLLPLAEPELRRKLKPNENGVSVWDRLAMRLAVAHLLSWESWNHSTKKAHDEAKATRDALQEEYRRYEKQFRELREYETERHERLKLEAFADDDRPFKTGIRAIRAWSRVREEWLRNGKAAQDRKQIVSHLQTKLRGKFGDPDLFLWLAEEGRDHLWNQSDTLTSLVTLNEAQRLLEKRKPYALMTFADARFHPRWAMFEGPGGSNLRNYDIESRNGELSLQLVLLQETETGGLVEKTFNVCLAPSGQLCHLAVAREGKKLLLKYRSGHQEFQGVPGGAEILFHRPYLEHAQRTDELIAQGAPGPVWCKFTVDVQPKAPKDWLDRRGKVAIPLEVRHFGTALSNQSNYAGKLETGLRVLSVDLGLRTFASCSVFELVKGRPTEGLFFPAADGKDTRDPEKLWAKHERSFKLCLPGETPTKLHGATRAAARDELRALKRDISRLRDILRLGIRVDNVERDEGVRAFVESLENGLANSALDSSILESLNDPKFRSTPELWQFCCQQVYDAAEKRVAQRFGEWRGRTRPKSMSWADWRGRRCYAGGKSIWMLEYLEAVRKLIMSWNLRGRSYGKVNRQDRKAYGTIASRLLHHINNLKEDRVKSGADFIIQAARGYIPVKDGVGWVKKFAPCRVILFEDLARYRFRLDRPRRENSQLMKWNHREILTEAAMQAEIYGMVVVTTSAGFSSRYAASSGAPGMRCRYLRRDDFEDGRPKPYVVAELEWMLGNSRSNEVAETQNALKENIQPGTWVPWNGGEMFVTLKPNGKPHMIHADINAAQNLQRRFWNRCGDAFRITCTADTIDGVQCYKLDREPAPRLLGALQQMEGGGGPFYLKDETGGQRYVMTPFAGKTGRTPPVREDVSIEDALEEALVELDEDSGGARETFFRDPSGILFNTRYWIPSKLFWSHVRARVWSVLRNR